VLLLSNYTIYILMFLIDDPFFFFFFFSSVISDLVVAFGVVCPL
jgi:hypothetical protein